jgi:hypothetical protein
VRKAQLFVVQRWPVSGGAVLPPVHLLQYRSSTTATFDYGILLWSDEKDHETKDHKATADFCGTHHQAWIKMLFV